MKFKKDNLTLIPVGGSEQIGMNANLYQFNEKWILVDPQDSELVMPLKSTNVLNYYSILSLNKNIFQKLMM